MSDALVSIPVSAGSMEDPDISHPPNADSEAAIEAQTLEAGPAAQAPRKKQKISAVHRAPLANPRRIDGQTRQRVTRACDRCRRRRARCNGYQPCSVCQGKPGTECTYHMAYGRGRIPSIPALAPTESESLSPTVVPVGAEIPPSSRVSPEPSQTDRQGHYVGPASGVAFLLRIQKRVHENVNVSFSPASSIFTFGDAPLPKYDTSFPMLLSRPEATALVARYFDFAVPTHRFLHRPTVEAWMHDYYETHGRMSSRDDARAQLAVLFMVFAQARDYLKPSDVGPGMDTGARYFLAAEQHLAQETGSVRLASVQARLSQCYYLLSQSRINHSWSLFGTMAHLALAIGLNRHRRADCAAGLGHIDAECRRRTFWCAYSLDNYLSAALGRPRTFHDDDIDQEMPSTVEDGDLAVDQILPASHRGQSLMEAPVAHVRLSRIVSGILHDLYPIRQISSAIRATFTAKYSSALQDWRVPIAGFLDAGRAHASLLMPVFQRQRNVLNLSYWHAVILTHRSLLLSNFANFHCQSTDKESTATASCSETSVKQCLSAAMSIIEIVDDLFQGKELYKAFWFTTYFAFSAVVIVYVFVIQQQRTAPHLDLQDPYRAYLAAASSCQQQIASLSEPGSLSQRYSMVLEELRVVTLQPETAITATAAPASGSPAPAQQRRDSEAFDASVLPPLEVPGVRNRLPALEDIQIPPDLVDLEMGASPRASALADATSWGHFNSIVSSGLWNLEALLSDDAQFQV